MTKTPTAALPPVVLYRHGTVEAEHPGEGDPIEIDLDELNTPPSFYAVGVDDDAILGSFETLKEALEERAAPWPKDRTGASTSSCKTAS